MNPGLVVKLRPTGPWRIGPDSGARNRVDTIYHSDTLYGAVTGALGRLGPIEEWLEATARATAPAVCFSSCFPFADEIGLVVPPSTIWPPTSPALLSARVRWKSARFVPLGIVPEILAGHLLDESQWSVDVASECLMPAGKQGPFRTGMRTNAAVDRLNGSTERHSTACIEFRAGAGLWTVISFADEAAAARWMDAVKTAFRLLADSGFGGERSRGWGRSEMPEFIEGMLPEMILPPVVAALPPEEPPLSEPVPVEEPPAETPSKEEPPLEEPPMEEPPPPPEEPEQAPPVKEPEEESAAEAPREEAAVLAPAAIAPLSVESAEAELARMVAEASAAPEVAVAPAEPAVAAPEPAPEMPVSPPAPDPEPPPPDPEPQPEPAPPVPEPEPEPPAPAPPVPEPEPQPVPEPGPILPEPLPAAPPPATAELTHPHWLLSLFTPGPGDSVDWGRGSYSLVARGGRIESPVRSGERKKQLPMIAEGSVLYAAAPPAGSAPDVAPEGFVHPVYRAGFALSIPLPEVR